MCQNQEPFVLAVFFLPAETTSLVYSWCGQTAIREALLNLNS